MRYNLCLFISISMQIVDVFLFLWMITFDHFSQTDLWQPASIYYIKEETQVHLYVPANSSESVKNLLQEHGITHEYVATLKIHLIHIYR